MSHQNIPDSKSGWLLKQSRGDGFIKNWRKRYIILEAGKLMYFVGCKAHHGITTGVELKGELNLENGKVFKGSGSGNMFQKNSKKQKQLYIVAGTDEHNLYLEASTPAEAETWILALTEHAQFATWHPSMVPKPIGRMTSMSKLSTVSSSTGDAFSSEDPNSARYDSCTQGQHDNTSPEDFRFSNDVLKTTITPTLYGLLLKTRDESSNTTVFMSIVSHPLCHDTTVTLEDEDAALSPQTSPATTNIPQPLAIVNPHCWYFNRDTDSSRRTATKLGLRHYCEPSLSKDRDPFVVMQVLISIDLFHSLLLEIEHVREYQKETQRDVPVSSQAVEFIELQKMYSVISAALAESHQVSCHKNFSIVYFEEQEYQPYFVSPMEIIIGRNRNNKRISFFTTVNNIQRHTETLLPMPGVQLHIRGQGLVPPKTVKGDITVIIKIHSHAVCDKMRDLQKTNEATTNTNMSSSHLEASSQRNLNHTLEECAKALFLWGEVVHHTNESGQEFYHWEVTTNTTIIRLCKLDNFERQRQTSSLNHSQGSASSPSSFSSSTATGPNITDVVTMYLLQSLARYFDVKLSGYTASMSDFGNPSLTLSPLYATDNMKDVTIKPVSIIKFSSKTRLASPLFTKEQHISNNYDSFLDANDMSYGDNTLEENHSRMSVSNIYSHDSFSLSSQDVLFTEAEFFSCKLKEMTSKGSSILDSLEDGLSEDNVTSPQHLIPEVTNSYKCLSYVITAELPTYVLDYPMEIKSKIAVNDHTSSENSTLPPAVITKVRKGDKISIFFVKECSDSTSWLLINSGWIPKSSGSCDDTAPFRLPTKLILRQPAASNLSRSEDTQGDVVVLVECLYEATQCKGKSIPFRRHFKSNLTKFSFNPFSYDNSSENFTSVPIVQLRRLRSSIDKIICQLKSLFKSDECQEESNSLIKAHEYYLNLGLKSMKLEANQKEDIYKSFLTPTKEDMCLTEAYFKSCTY